jgi:hypothetical protein
LNKYKYEGPVETFGRCITQYWEAYTTAVSERKALSNFAYKFKRENNREAWTKIILPGKIVKVEA